MASRDQSTSSHGFCLEQPTKPTPDTLTLDVKCNCNAKAMV